MTMLGHYSRAITTMMKPSTSGGVRLFGSTSVAAYNKVILIGTVTRAPEFRPYGSTLSTPSTPSTNTTKPTGTYTFTVGTYKRVPVRSQPSEDIQADEQGQDRDSVPRFTGTTVFHNIKTSQTVDWIQPGYKVLVEGELVYWKSEKTGNRGVEIRANKIGVVTRGGGDRQQQEQQQGEGHDQQQGEGQGYQQQQ